MKKAPNEAKSPEVLAYSLYNEALDTLEEEEDSPTARLFAIGKLREAIRIDPHCYDAHLSLLVLESKSREALIKSLDTLILQAKEYGQEDLDDITGEDGTNHAWLNWELRPYLRMLHCRAELLHTLGKVSLAIERSEKTRSCKSIKCGRATARIGLFNGGTHARQRLLCRHRRRKKKLQIAKSGLNSEPRLFCLMTQDLVNYFQLSGTEISEWHF